MNHRAHTILALVACSVTISALARGGDDEADVKPAVDAARRTDATRMAGFPATAYEYARMVEPELGVPPRVDLGEAVEIPLFRDGKRAHGVLGKSCDNPSFLGKGMVSGSTIQRHEGRTADGTPLPDVVWVSFGRNSSPSRERVVASVQMIGYHRETGATAFFESSDRVAPWVTLDEGTLRMRGVLPWIDDPEQFNRAFVTPGAVQCVGCHQSDPFITNAFINAAKIPGTKETVVPILDENAPYYVLGGETWDMRTLHIEDNACFDCHRVGMSTVEMFLQNGWTHEKYMPPHRPGSLGEDWQALLTAWRTGQDAIEGVRWTVPPAKGEDARVVGDDYPHKAYFNEPGGSFLGGGRKMAEAFAKNGDSQEGSAAKGGGPNAAAAAEVERLLDQLEDPDVRAAFEGWIEKNGVSAEVLQKLRSMARGGKKQGKG
ncbi:MAG: hypothetical protein AAF957_19920 [Planctomycetota bacterium]